MKIFGGFFIEKDVDFISESVYKDNVRKRSDASLLFDNLEKNRMK
jgi:hypothetical protein